MTKGGQQDSGIQREGGVAFQGRTEDCIKKEGKWSKQHGGQRDGREEARKEIKITQEIGNRIGKCKGGGGQGNKEGNEEEIGTCMALLN